MISIGAVYTAVGRQPLPYSTKVKLCEYFADHPAAVDSIVAAGLRPQAVIESVIREEELLYEKTIENCKDALLLRYNSLSEITPEDMVQLKQERGCDPSIAEALFSDTFSEKFHARFESLWAAHCLKGRAGIKRQVIVAK